VKASDGSAVVEQLSHDPMFEGSNPAAVDTGRGKIGKQCLSVLSHLMSMAPEFEPANIGST
jgi:hypothetical protein